jgi:GTP-binding protein HflX
LSPETDFTLPSRRYAVERKIQPLAKRSVFHLTLDPSDGAGLSWLYRHSEVLSKGMDDDGKLAVTVRADPKNADMVRRKFLPQVPVQY